MAQALLSIRLRGMNTECGQPYSTAIGLGKLNTVQSFQGELGMMTNMVAFCTAFVMAVGMIGLLFLV